MTNFRPPTLHIERELQNPKTPEVLIDYKINLSYLILGKNQGMGTPQADDTLYEGRARVLNKTLLMEERRERKNNFQAWDAFPDSEENRRLAFQKTLDRAKETAELLKEEYSPEIFPPRE